MKFLNYKDINNDFANSDVAISIISNYLTLTSYIINNDPIKENPILDASFRCRVIEKSVLDLD